MSWGTLVFPVRLPRPEQPPYGSSGHAHRQVRERPNPRASGTAVDLEGSAYPRP